MSYILDALRKSEQERQGGAVPMLGAPPRTSRGGRRRRLAAWTGAVALLGASAAAWLVLPGLENDDGNTPQPPAPADPAAAGTRSPAMEVHPESDHPVGDAAAPRTGEVAGNPGNSDSRARARVDDLSLTVVSYSDTPERRFVMINQRILRESESVADGVVVRRILPEGVILGVGTEEVLLEPR